MGIHDYIVQLNEKISDYGSVPEIYVRLALGKITCSDVIGNYSNLTEFDVWQKALVTRALVNNLCSDDDVSAWVDLVDDELGKVGPLPKRFDSDPIANKPTYAVVGGVGFIEHLYRFSSAFSYADALSFLEGKNPFYSIDENGNTYELDYGPRWWVTGYDMCTAIQLARAARAKNDSTNFDYGVNTIAKQFYDYLENNLWTGDHYKYAAGWADYEFHIVVLVNMLWLDTLRDTGINQHVLTDIYNRFTKDGLNSNVLKYDTFIMKHHYPDNNQGRCANAKDVVYLLKMVYPKVSDAEKQNIDAIIGSWENLFSSGCYDSNTGMFKCTDDGSASANCTAKMMMALLEAAIFPVSTERSLVPFGHTDGYNPSMEPALKYLYEERKLYAVLSEGQWKLRLFNEETITVPSDGYYEITFDQNGNVAIITRLGDPPAQFDYIDQPQAPTKIPTNLLLEIIMG